MKAEVAMGHVPCKHAAPSAVVVTGHGTVGLLAALRSRLGRLGRRLALTPEQADQLARIKFPCC